jgi:superfamily II DNA/RNA helicase
MRTANDFDALNFLADEALAGQPFKRTIIFFNTWELAYKGSQYLKKLLPDARQHEIDFLHAGRTGRARRRVLMNFRKQEVNILCATEAAGVV